MTHSKQTICAFRYGYGFGQGLIAQDASELMMQLSGADHMAARYPIFGFQDAIQNYRSYAKMKKAEKNGDQSVAEKRKAFRRSLSAQSHLAMRNTMMRAVYSADPFRERLVHFWIDHFTVAAKNLRLSLLLPPMIEEAIRPNITGKFQDLLIAATLHPAMLEYLDQSSSIGPNSKLGRRKKRGLNENLARELLELHTLGVEGSYGQNDVRQLAELLTGLHISPKGTGYNKNWVEPGAKVVLGKTYGGGDPSITDIKAFLIDVSQRKETARHIARKLIVHFVSMRPNPEYVEHVAQRYLASAGDLLQTYDALVSHPAGFSNVGQKVRTPFEFVVSGLRTMQIEPKVLENLPARKYRRTFTVPMRLMGQPMFRPSGPDGWTEEPEEWITPSALAGRLQWAMQVTEPQINRLDPRQFIKDAVGELATPALQFSTSKSANKQEALALVLASPEFNRR